MLALLLSQRHSHRFALLWPKESMQAVGEW
jgi:hypothetical protein